MSQEEASTRNKCETKDSLQEKQELKQKTPSKILKLEGSSHTKVWIVSMGDTFMRLFEGIVTMPQRFWGVVGSSDHFDNSEVEEIDEQTESLVSFDLCDHYEWKNKDEEHVMRGKFNDTVLNIISSTPRPAIIQNKNKTKI